MSSPFNHHADGVSFLPEDYVAKKAEGRANMLCLILFGVVMFAVIGAFFVTNRQWLSVRAEQEAINKLYAQETKKIEQLKALEEQKAEMLQKAEVTTALIEKVPRSVLLAEIVNRMPQNITLESVDLKSKRINQTSTSKSPLGKPVATVKTLTGANGKATNVAQTEKTTIKPPTFEYTLTLIGVAVANSHITDYVAHLTQSSLLEGVDLSFIENTVKNEVEMRKFQITARIKPDADARSIVAPASLDFNGTATVTAGDPKNANKPGDKKNAQKPDAVTAAPEEGG
jgi:Tfp pilus assembly protein PilN